MGRRRVSRGWRLSRSKSTTLYLLMHTIEAPQHPYPMLEKDTLVAPSVKAQEIEDE